VPAFFLMFVLLLQIGLGYTPLHAGLTGLPFSFGAAFSAGMSIRLSPKFGRRLQTSGSVFVMVGVFLIGLAVYHYGTATTSFEVLPGLLIAGLGMGQVLPPLVTLVLSGVPQQQSGSASGVLTTSQQVGGAIGIALMGLVFFGLLGHYGGASADQVTP